MAIIRERVRRGQVPQAKTGIDGLIWLGWRISDQKNESGRPTMTVHHYFS